MIREHFDKHTKINKPQKINILKYFKIDFIVCTCSLERDVMGCIQTEFVHMLSIYKYTYKQLLQ